MVFQVADIWRNFSRSLSLGIAWPLEKGPKGGVGHAEARQKQVNVGQEANGQMTLPFGMDESNL